MFIKFTAVSAGGEAPVILNLEAIVSITEIEGVVEVTDFNDETLEAKEDFSYFENKLAL